jgi:hypothetical protein
MCGYVGSLVATIIDKTSTDIENYTVASLDTLNTLYTFQISAWHHHASQL